MCTPALLRSELEPGCYPLDHLRVPREGATDGSTTISVESVGAVETLETETPRAERCQVGDIGKESWTIFTKPAGWVAEGSDGPHRTTESMQPVGQEASKGCRTNSFSHQGVAEGSARTSSGSSQAQGPLNGPV